MKLDAQDWWLICAVSVPFVPGLWKFVSFLWRYAFPSVPKDEPRQTVYPDLRSWNTSTAQVPQRRKTRYERKKTRNKMADRSRAQNRKK